MLYVNKSKTIKPNITQNTQLHFYSKTALKFYGTHVWRLMFLINSNTVYSALVKKIFNTSSTIPAMFIGYEIFIYSGLK
jgi:hypothetical protein